MLKIYSLVITVIAIATPIFVNMQFTMPAITKIQNQKQEIAQVRWDLEDVQLSIQKKNDEINSLNDSLQAKDVLLNEQNEKIHTLESDFQQLIANPIAQEVPEEKEMKASASTPVDMWLVWKKIEIDTINLAYRKWLWKVNLPYIKGSNIPDLKSLYELTWSERMKSIIESSCPKAYYLDSQWNRDDQVTALIKWYCDKWKEEMCSDDILMRINAIRWDMSALNTVWFQLITIYDENMDFSQRMLAYYDKLWNRVCAWRWAKTWETEKYLRLK